MQQMRITAHGVWLLPCFARLLELDQFVVAMVSLGFKAKYANYGTRSVPATMFCVSHKRKTGNLV